MGSMKAPMPRGPRHERREHMSDVQHARRRKDRADRNRRVRRLPLGPERRDDRQVHDGAVEGERDFGVIDQRSKCSHRLGGYRRRWPAALPPRKLDYSKPVSEATSRPWTVKAQITATAMATMRIPQTG